MYPVAADITLVKYPFFGQLIFMSIIGFLITLTNEAHIIYDFATGESGIIKSGNQETNEAYFVISIITRDHC